MVLIHGMSYVFKVFPTAQSVYHFHFPKLFWKRFFFCSGKRIHSTMEGWWGKEIQRRRDEGREEGRERGKKFKYFLGREFPFQSSRRLQIFLFLTFCWFSKTSNMIKHDETLNDSCLSQLVFVTFRWCHAQITDRNTVNCKLDTEMGDFCSLRCYNLMAKERKHVEVMSGKDLKGCRK